MIYFHTKSVAAQESFMLVIFYCEIDNVFQMERGCHDYKINTLLSIMF